MAIFRTVRRLLACLFALPLSASAHPGTGLLCNSRSTLFYTNLQHVWKIERGRKSIAVPNVHTHELYLDASDNLYGENEQYEGEATDRYHHYFWMLRPDGTLDTVVSRRQAYVGDDYALARDRNGAEYFFPLRDTTRILKRTPDGRIRLFAQGNFGKVA